MTTINLIKPEDHDGCTSGEIVQRINGAITLTIAGTFAPDLPGVQLETLDSRSCWMPHSSYSHAGSVSLPLDCYGVRVVNGVKREGAGAGYSVAVVLP